MNSTGCGFLLLASLTLLVGFVPFLAWTNLVIALPLAIVGVISTAATARKPTAQAADTSLFWIALGLVALIIVRMVML